MERIAQIEDDMEIKLIKIFITIPICILRAVVETVFLYGSEKWTLTRKIR